MSETNQNKQPDNIESCSVDIKNLSDERRIKVLSPSMLVMKRFIRNKLAITGLIILVVMFVFSFIGGLLMPYRQQQVFLKQEEIPKEYAAALYNTELRTISAPGEEFDKAAFAQLMLALTKDQTAFSSNGVSYSFVNENDYYLISRIEVVANVIARKMLFSYTPVEGQTLSEELKAAYEAAVKAGETSFTFDGETYIAGKGTETFIGRPIDCAIASRNVFDSASVEDQEVVSTYAFHLAAEQAIAQEQASFTLDGVTYSLVAENLSHRVIKDGETIALVSTIIVNPYIASNFLSLDLKEAIRSAVYEEKSPLPSPTRPERRSTTPSRWST